MPAVEVICPPGTTFSVGDQLSAGGWAVLAGCTGAESPGSYYVAAAGGETPDAGVAAQMFANGFGFVGVILLVGWGAQAVLNFIFPDRQ